MDLDLDHLEQYSTDELEAAAQALDAQRAVLRERQVVLGDALAQRHAQAVVQARVDRMGDEERQQLVVALQGIPSAEAVGSSEAVQTIGPGEVADLKSVLGG